MVKNSGSSNLANSLVGELPFLRRYARALTGAQELGDSYALAALKHALSDLSLLSNASSTKVGLFKCFVAAWQDDGFEPVREADQRTARAQSYLLSLTSRARQALLLFANEEFSVDQVAEIMDLSLDETAALIESARREIKASTKGSILIIEDESMIAMDLQDIAQSMGHRITGSAPTQSHAIALAAQDRPDMILSDIKLADGTSGIDAVNDILKAAASIPVVFVTAFPELLLTGDREEPAFLITKPYSEEQVESAISQAMFFRSTEEMVV